MSEMCSKKHWVNHEAGILLVEQQAQMRTSFSAHFENALQEGQDKGQVCIQEMRWKGIMVSAKFGEAVGTPYCNFVFRRCLRHCLQLLLVRIPCCTRCPEQHILALACQLLLQI